MAKFKVGDILIGSGGNAYIYTNHETKVKVRKVNGEDLRVECLSGAEKGTTFDVKAGYFVLVSRKRAQKKLPRYMKAMVLDNAGYEDRLKRGSVVTLDFSDVYTTGLSAGEELVRVVGSTWGRNCIDRFVIDPVLA